MKILAILFFIMTTAPSLFAQSQYCDLVPTTLSPEQKVAEKKKLISFIKEEIQKIVVAEVQKFSTLNQIDLLPYELEVSIDSEFNEIIDFRVHASLTTQKGSILTLSNFSRHTSLPDDISYDKEGNLSATCYLVGSFWGLKIKNSKTNYELWNVSLPDSQHKLYDYKK